MFAYVYVVSSPELTTSKIGFTTNLKSRLAGLASSSSAPFVWRPWKVYQLASSAEARKLENLVKSDHGLAQFLISGKREFFDCRPSIVTEAVAAVAHANNIILLSNFPYCVEAIDQISKLFPSTPDEVVASLSDQERAAYWIGARDVLRVLSYLDGVDINVQAFKELAKQFEINRMHGAIELWETVVGHFRNSGTSSSRRMAESAANLIAKDKANARTEWQDDC